MFCVRERKGEWVYGGEGTFERRRRPRKHELVLMLDVKL